MNGQAARLVSQARALLDTGPLPELGAMAYRCGQLETLLRLACDELAGPGEDHDGAADRVPCRGGTGNLDHEARFGDRGPHAGTRPGLDDHDIAADHE